MKRKRFLPLAAIGLSFAAMTLTAQPPGGGGFGGGGFGGPPGGAQRKILKDFDTNKDGWLNDEERKEARVAAKKDQRGPRGGFGGPGGMGRGKQEFKPGPKVNPSDVAHYPDAPLYDASVLRTIFLTFENADWESELEDFHGTDVEVPCTMVVDGKTYKNVGIHFRGMSSYMGVSAGGKRSLNVSMDLADSKQRLKSYKTLNLLNGHDDASFLSTVLYSTISNQHIPTPKANMVKVVINGESWGIYTNVQQFDKVFLEEHFKTTKGTRWKVRGSPGGRGGLEYFGDNFEDYKRIFEMKSHKDGVEDPAAWKALINLCKVINTTPVDKLPAALEPIMDVDAVLWFLALDCSLNNMDGYWTRASDYSIYLDPKGKFHVIPHDMNECFRAGGGGPPGGMRFMMPKPGEILPEFIREPLNLSKDQEKQLADLQKEIDTKLAKILTEEQRKTLEAPMGFGGGRGPGGQGGGGPGGPPGMGGGGGINLDPLVGLTDARKPLRSKLLAVPKYKEQYLKNVKTIAEKDLDWGTLGLLVAKYKTMLEKEIEADTRKLSTYEEFQQVLADKPGAAKGRETPLRTYADDRRKFLLNYVEKK
ncbi:hypothetical protein BH11PLA2_BH11PLA2_18480 [soil metagenome]